MSMRDIAHRQQQIPIMDTAPRATGFSTDYTQITSGDGTWGQNAQGVTFSAVGNVSYTLVGGKDYSASGGMAAYSWRS